jgi:hypothetical protein
VSTANRRGPVAPAVPSRQDGGMLPGLVTPTHLLLILAALAVFFGLRRLSRRGARTTGVARGRGLAFRSLRWRKPTRAQAHVGWLLISALVAFAFTRAVALPLFLIVFFALWLCGYGVLARLYR